jgi:hypothetical protein
MVLPELEVDPNQSMLAYHGLLAPCEKAVTPAGEATLTRHLGQAWDSKVHKGIGSLFSANLERRVLHQREAKVNYTWSGASGKELPFDFIPFSDAPLPFTFSLSQLIVRKLPSVCSPVLVSLSLCITTIRNSYYKG